MNVWVDWAQLGSSLWGSVMKLCGEYCDMFIRSPFRNEGHITSVTENVVDGLL